MSPVQVTISILLPLSIVLGSIKAVAIMKHSQNASAFPTWHWKVLEVWSGTVNFFIALLIGYYLLFLRYPKFVDGITPNASDFVLFIIFLLGVFGNLSVFSKNVTESVQAIIQRVLR